MPARESLINRVAEYCAGLFPKGSSVLAAVSGGGDSTALLLLLNQLKKKGLAGNLGVAHVNYGLRGEASDGDEVFVLRLAEKLNVPFYVKKVSGRTLGQSGIEEWARKERYTFFREVMKREKFDVLATGHTADDQAETVLMRLLRGTGIRGLRGVLPVREDGVVRPILGLWREELQDWLSKHDIRFRHDATNDDNTFIRNKVRHELLPALVKKNKHAMHRLVAIAGSANEFWIRYHPRVIAWINAYARKNRAGFTIAKQGFADGLHAAEGVRSLFDDAGIQADAIHLESILANASRSRGQTLLPGGWRCHFRPGELVFSHASQAPYSSVPMVRYALKTPGTTAIPERNISIDVEGASADEISAIPQDNLTVVLDRDACGENLLFRTVRKSDRFQPLGRLSTVPVLEFLAKQKIPAEERRTMGVVSGKAGRIIWIPGIRISHAARVEPRTRRFWKFSYQSYPSII